MHAENDLPWTPFALNETDTVGDAVDQMAHSASRYVPVIRGDRVVAFLSDADPTRPSRACTEVEGFHFKVGAPQVRLTFASRGKALPLRPAMPLSEALRLMIDGNALTAPVMDAQGWLAGILNCVDVAREMIEPTMQAAG
jgi:CBS domain-containing protein